MSEARSRTGSDALAALAAFAASSLALAATGGEGGGRCIHQSIAGYAPPTAGGGAGVSPWSVVAAGGGGCGDSQ